MHFLRFAGLALVPAVVLIVPWRLAAQTTPAQSELRAAVTRALPLINKAAVGHTQQRSCFSCHHQTMAVLALTTARAHGFTVDEAAVGAQTRFTAEFLSRNRESFRAGKGTGGQADSAGYALWTLAGGGWAGDETTAAVAEYLLRRDADLDHWRNVSTRPPTEASAFTTTFVALRGLKQYATAEQVERANARLAQARDWLLKAQPLDTEDRVFRLRALKLVGAPSESVQRAALELKTTQRDNGGWAQTDALAPDAYATGSALAALHEASGLPVTEAAYRRGLAFLLRTQLPDGSWQVKSRSKPFQEYFESGFPHGTDQWISMPATAWATVALTLACE